MKMKNNVLKGAVKVFGLAAVLIGILVLTNDGSRGSEMLLLAGLFILFISHETREDERSATLKASSTQMALIIGYAISLLSTNLYDHQVINVQLVAINHFLILVFALALIIYNIRLHIA
ncbi:hypothetical protein GCM10007415_24470 [Parapedobacter pyrenivorans]|uniref:Uncharacterized protein n=2 Tax=Parapedobacter pyrenivorans TaxID=1305674 RepID=A0A917HUB7_9SPHI|nr:hypothetical protein GCM10007415_24470 [Parapedobacter pyrenivorans]